MSGQEIQHNECSMCGDVGFAKDLLLCKNCNYRYQHTYCSRLYPNLDMDSWACEWCLYLQDRKNTTVKLRKRKAFDLPESRNSAFEFLLQIAESLPQEIGIQGDVSGSCRRDKVLLNCNRINEQPNHIWKEESRPSEDKDSVQEIPPLPGCKQEISTLNCRHTAKRQRCNHPTPEKKKSTTLASRWGHLTANKIHCNPIRRRYKLLADVLC